MAILKCKMCGGDLTVEEGMTVCECEYCGTNQTVPKVDDEKKINLYTRANRLRTAGEFDKAYGVYENIISDFPEEAEAYWGLVLCKYGIEYVDDPKTANKVPTCHRSSFDNVMEDSNFEMVMEYSDAISRKVYREEAKKIEELRTSIIAVSTKEEPYDIFICYKETDDYGERTIDSVLAQDVYTVLTEKGYRVFFSRISLEDKLGQEYEPYIFAALNSAKIMLAFGTDYEYYNSVWVKNEWSRFLALIEKGEKKTLIPCFKDIDAYDMPAEFKKLQAQDMGKVGAIQDLVRGVEKIIPKKEDVTIQKESKSEVNEEKAKIDNLLERAALCLKNEDWEKADECCEKVLDYDAKNAMAYLGKALSEWHFKTFEDLAGGEGINIDSEKERKFSESKNYKVLERLRDEDFTDSVLLNIDNFFSVMILLRGVQYIIQWSTKMVGCGYIDQEDPALSMIDSVDETLENAKLVLGSVIIDNKSISDILGNYSSLGYKTIEQYVSYYYDYIENKKNEIKEVRKHIEEYIALRIRGKDEDRNIESLKEVIQGFEKLNLLGFAPDRSSKLIESYKRRISRLQYIIDKHNSMTEWGKKVESTILARQVEEKKRKDQLVLQNEERIKKIMELIKENQVEVDLAIQKQKNTIESANEELLKLGLFNVTRKKELKTTIDSCTGKIKEIESDYLMKQKDSEKAIEEINKSMDVQTEKIKQELNKEFSLPILKIANNDVKISDVLIECGIYEILFNANKALSSSDILSYAKRSDQEYKNRVYECIDEMSWVFDKTYDDGYKYSLDESTKKWFEEFKPYLDLVRKYQDDFM